MSIRTTSRRLLAAFAVLAAAAFTLVAVPAGAQAATDPAPVCQNNGFYPGGQTCIQLVATGFGSYSVQATGTTTSGVPSAYLTLTGPGGVPDSSPPAKLPARTPVSYSSGIAAAAGRWCATLTYKDPFFGLTWTATTSPAPCVTVPQLPAPAGSPRQVCVTANYPQFETCIDVVNGGVVAKAYATVNSPSAYLVLTGPNGFTSQSPTIATTAGQTYTFAGPVPAAAGQWCASYWNTFPVLGFPVNVTGKTPLCLTV